MKIFSGVIGLEFLYLAYLYRWHWCQSRCRCPGRHAWQNRQDGSHGNKWNGPHVQQNTLSQTWFREQGLPERGRWWELWEREREHERKAGHMWSKPPDILWHSLPGDIHVSLGSALPSWERTVQMPHLQSTSTAPAIFMSQNFTSSQMLCYVAFSGKFKACII